MNISEWTRKFLKSGTSPGAHFRETLRARSKSGYAARMNGGLMELEETLDWKQETNELIAIFVSLIRKWRGK